MNNNLTIIIVDNNGIVKGGTAQVAISSAIELKNRGYNVVYIAGDDKIEERIIDRGIKYFCLNNSDYLLNKSKFAGAVKGIFDRKVAKCFKMILNNYNQSNTIIHIHGFLHNLSTSIFKVCKELKFKTILTLHDYFIVCPNGGLYNYREDTFCLKKPMSLQCVFCNCDKRSYLQKLWRLVRQMYIIKYINRWKNLNLIYISEFSFSKMKDYIIKGHSINYIRNPYDLGDEKKYLAEKSYDYVYLGRISVEKGVDIFCKAFTELIADKRIKGSAVVIGDGEQRLELQEKYPLIKFVGWKTHNELNEYMTNARALVFPSKWYETAGLTPIEAMAHGVPCIISDMCAAIEYISDKYNGLLFKSGNVEDLKEKIIEAENQDNWVEICANLRKSFDSNQFSLKGHVDKLLNLYECISNEKAKNFNR